MMNVIDIHHNGKNIAYLRAKPRKRKDDVYIEALYVSPKYRGEGLASKLLHKAVDKYKNKELQLTADPFKDRPLSVHKLKKFYTSHGFESVGRWQMVRKPLEKEAERDILDRALGGGFNKLAVFTWSFADELEKISGGIVNGDQMQYFLDNPEKYEEWKERQKGKVKTAQVNPYQQKTQWTCSAACLKAVLEHWGVRLPELVVIEAIGTKKGRGAECDEIAAGARKLGFLAFEYSFDSIEQAKVLLDQDIPIICDIRSFTRNAGHYVVMHAVLDKVELMDPNTPGNRRVISKEEMDERWWDYAIAPPHDLMIRHGIIVIPPEDSGGTP